MGRPSKIDDVILLPDGKGGTIPRVRWEVIVERVRAGSYPEVAAASTGINRSTFYRWKLWGEDRIENGKLRRARPGYKDFQDALQRAEAEGEMVAVAHLQRAMPDDWRAASWYLERRGPDRWRRRDSLYHGGPAEGDAPLEIGGKVDLGGAALDKLGDVLDILAESGALDRSSGTEGDST